MAEIKKKILILKTAKLVRKPVRIFLRTKDGRLVKLNAVKIFRRVRK